MIEDGHLQPYFLHMDLDAFFASVEQLDFPQYRDKPVIVGGFPSDRRSVVSTCSYEARKFGVHSAMPIAQAFRLCPQAIYLRGRMDRYREKSREVMAVLADFSPDVRQISIDEACLDITGTERLFGAPETTAQLLKQRIFEKTSLTVSVGLASTKYLAKLASGMSKPDGFFFIPPGREEAFMLSLPLTKIWGIGGKTLERLHAAGLFTARDVHAASENLLRSLFGNASGSFLYRVVRGLEEETSAEHPKSRSISSETTFSVDITDTYTLETQLMMLSQDVMFRTLDEKVSSKTAHIKIRYEDFTTVSAQETAERHITTAQELYDRAAALFKKKYLPGRGVRLLGVGLQNMEEGGEKQGELFDGRRLKQEALEKTLFELRQKHPQAQVQKARLLTPSGKGKKKPFKPLSVLLPLLLAPLFFLPQQVQAQISLKDLPKPIQAEAPQALFQYTQDDTAIEFLASGSWESKLTSSATFTFEKNKALRVQFEPVIFTQKADLSLWFLLNRQWYFEANFVDGYNKNSVAAGYYGEGVLKHARAGNSGIVFPERYDTLIGGGDIIAPGVMADFAGSKWQANAAVRYDSAEYGEKIFSGSSELNSQSVAVANWTRGTRFVLPSSAIAADIRNIYVEDDKSPYAVYSDAQGRKYRQLQTSEYFVLPAQALLLLAASVKGRVAVSFYTQSKTSLLPVLGSFGVPSAFMSGSGFLGDVQDFFGSASAAVPDIWKYSYPGSKTGAGDFFTTLSNGAGETLILYEYPLFSPFEAANRYNMGSSSGNLAVIHTASGAAEPSLLAAFTTDALGAAAAEASALQENLAKISWAELYRAGFTPPAGEPPLVSPQVRYPAADSSPLAYLQSASPAPQGTDLAIKAENYTPSAGYVISTDAIPGTIRVYRNGMLDTAYTYKPLTGEILFYTHPSTYDTIRITWLENNPLAKNASLAAAVGFTYDILPELHFITSISTRWSFSEQKYSDAGSSLPGSAEAAAKIEWKKDDLLLSNTVKGSLEVQDVTGLHRVLGMDDSQPRTIYLLEDSAVALPAGIAPVINIAGATPVPLDYNNKRDMAAAAVNGAKYGIQGYAVEMNWQFDADKQWAAETLDLGGSASELQSASRFSILLQGNALTAADSTLYLQLGVSAKTDFTFENTASIRTWEIENTKLISAGNGWQLFTVELTDADRSLLCLNKNARLVAVANSGTPSSASLVAGYARLGGISFVQTAGKPVTIEQTPPPVPLSQAARFNQNGPNTVLHLQWGTQQQGWSSGDSAEITRYIPALPFSSYKTLNFYALKSGTTATENTDILIEFKRRDKDTGVSYTVLSYTKNTSDFPAGSWEQVSLPLPEIDSEDSPTQVVITLRGNGVSPTDIPQGSIYLDEFFLEGMVPQYRFENTAEFKWESSMPLIKAGNFVILEKPKAAVKSSVAVTSQNSRVKTGLDARAEAGLTLLKTDLGGFIYKDQEKNRAFESAGHNLKSNWPVFNIAENYVFHAASRATQKKDSIEIGATVLEQPFLLSFMTEGAFINNYTKQNAQIKLDAAFPIKNTLYSLRAEFQADQLRPDASRAESYSYGSAWTGVSAVQFSAGSADAQTRQAKGRLFQSLKLPFAGFLPAIELEALSRYTATSSVIHTDHSSALFEFPFIVGQNQFRLFWTKGAGAEKPVSAGGNYVSDARLYGQSAASQTWLYTAPPVADLFLPYIAADMQTTLHNTPFLRQSTLLYESKYGFSFQKPAFFSMADLFVPSKLSAQYGKEIRVSASDISERYLAETSWALAAYNVFGRFSKRPVFNWYEQDEIIQSYNISVSYGNNFLETYKITAGAYLSAVLFFNEKDFFKSENSFQFQSNGDWKLLNSLQINYSGKKSFISALALLIRPTLAEKDPMDISRKDTLTYSAAKGTELYQEISFMHTLTTAVTAIISFSAEAGIIVTTYEKKVTVSPQISISGKLTF